MTSTRVLIIVTACSMAVVAGQAPPEPPAFRVAVDVVSIDAVVTDRNGEVVRDLAAADFEVFQDGRPQRVTAAAFVPVTADGGSAATSARSSPVLSPPANGVPPMPAPPITREQVRRTIVVVVDDLGLSSQGMRNLLPALRRFVRSALLPTDVAAIVRTGQSNGVAQSLTNDRVALEATIDALRYNVSSRTGPWPFGDVIQLGTSPPEFDGPQRPLSSVASLAALNLIVQAARDLPGRKTMIFASEGLQLALGTAPTTLPDQDPRVRDALDRVIDQAARSGVVIYTIDCTGLETGGLRASDDIHYVPDMSGAVRRFTTARQATIRDAQESLAYLAAETGGFAVVNTNDLAIGLGRIGSDVREYYVIGYEPDPDTFAPERRLARRHTITVKIKRAGVRVRTRKAFIGVSDPEPPSAPPTPVEALVRAAMSPFNASAIGLHATHLPGYSRERGMFVRAVLHVDARALTFSADAAGTRTATVDLAGLVFDSDGVKVHSISTGFNVTLEDRSAEQAIQDGLVYTARVPIARPGAYHLRFAVRDRRSGAVGAVGGFALLPDVAGGALALSGLVLRADQRTASGGSLDSDRFSVPPTDARRVHAPGTPLTYSYEIYNAGKKVDVVATLWRGEDRLASFPADTLVPLPGGRPLSAGGRLMLTDDLPAGTYVLQIAATSDDPKHEKRNRATVQRLSFDVR